jgi:hypothetical protein
MIEITHDFLFFVDLVVVFLITLSCLKIAYRWKKIELLFINFFSLGITYSLVFIFLTLWDYTHSLFYLIVGNILFFVWVILFSIGTFILVFPKKSPFDYAPSIYILIPFIYLFTRSIEITFNRTLSLSGFIMLLTFIKLLLFGKKPIKIASIFGFMAGLVSVFYTFVVLIGLNIPMYSFILNIFLAISFIGFWYISKNRPDDFLNNYKIQEDVLYRT